VPSLSEYCTALSQDPDALKEFKKSDEAALAHMKRAGLSEKHQQMLLRNNKDEITNEFVAECGPAGGAKQVLPTLPGG